MAAVTGVITAVAGLGLTAYKMYQANEDKQSADKAAKAAASRLRSVKEKNEFESLQAPDVSRLQYEANAAGTAMNVEALQGMGTEGAGQIAKLEQVGRASNLQAAEDQAQINYSRDKANVQNKSEIENRRAQRESAIEYSALEGAQKASAEARETFNAGLGEAVYGLGDLGSSIGNATSLDAKAQRASRRSGKGYESSSFDSGAWDDFRGINNELNIQ